MENSSRPSGYFWISKLSDPKSRATINRRSRNRFIKGLRIFPSSNSCDSSGKEILFRRSAVSPMVGARLHNYRSRCFPVVPAGKQIPGARRIKSGPGQRNTITFTVSISVTFTDSSHGTSSMGRRHAFPRLAFGSCSRNRANWRWLDVVRHRSRPCSF